MVITWSHICRFHISVNVSCMVELFEGLENFNKTDFNSKKASLTLIICIPIFIAVGLLKRLPACARRISSNGFPNNVITINL